MAAGQPYNHPDMGDRLVTEEEMLRRALELVAPLAGSERLQVSAAGGRIAAAPATSLLDVPAAPIATMDGFAARRKDLPGTLSVAGKSSAGAPWDGTVPPASAVRVATGAWVPAELDIVIPQEDARATAGRVELPAARQRPAHIRPASSEVQAGATILRTGERLTSRKLTLLASLGIGQVKVALPPRVGVLATGDELRQPGENLAPGAIYDANRPLMLNLLQRHGCNPVDLGVARDESVDLQAALCHGMQACDAIITIGGASVGERDLLRDTVAKLGEMHAWKVALKPGKPFVLAKLGHVPLFGLPGNPASVFVTFLCLVLPALWRMAGCNPLPALPWMQARTAVDLPKDPGRQDYQRGCLTATGDGTWSVRLAGPQGSGSIPVLAEADCLIRLPLAAGPVAAGTLVSVLPLSLVD